MGARTRGYSRGAARRSGLGASAATGAETPEYYDYNFYGHWGDFLFYHYFYHCCYIWHYDCKRWNWEVYFRPSVPPTYIAVSHIRAAGNFRRLLRGESHPRGG